MTTSIHTDAGSPRIRLIASDLDGTLLGADGSVSSRTRAALDAARTAGIHVIPVTARQPIGLRAIGAEAGFDDWALCSNGAFAVHLVSDELLFAQELGTETLRSLTEALTESVPGLLFASVRDGGEGFVAQHGYAELAGFIDHKRDPTTMGGVPLEDVLAAPTLKLVIRHPELAPTVLFEAVRALGLTGFEATLSGAPFVEVMAEGVTKATGLARLCERLDIDRTEVIAFGDALNDVEMLRWAGRGVAVANASPVVRDAADEIAPAHTEDGVAQVLEALLR